MPGIKKLYMAIACWAGAGAVIYLLPPGNWWTEFLMLFLIWLGTWWFISFIAKKRSLSFWLAVAVVTLMLLKRLELLNWISFGVWLVVTGLISIWA